MVDAALVGAAGLALGAGVATFFSPCAYALLPGYVGYYAAAVGDGEDAPLAGALVRGLAATAGVVAVIGVLAVAVLLLGGAVLAYVDLLEPVVGVALVVLGLLVLAGRGPGWHARLPERRRSVLGFAVFGGGYAVAAAGCVAPLFLAIVVRALTFPPVEALVVLGAYAGGLGVFLLGATVAVAVGHAGAIDRLARHRQLVDRLAGLALVAAGVGQLLLAA